jgi:hypothetical protein
MRYTSQGICVLSLLISLLFAPWSGAAEDYRSLPLQELPQSGTISLEATSLAGAVRHYRAVKQMPDRLAVYIWKASLEKEWQKEPIGRTFVTELKQLQTATAGTPTQAISVVAVYGTDSQRQQLCRRIQGVMRDEAINIPTLIDSSRKLADAIAHVSGAPRASVPELVLLNAGDLKIIERRGDSPAWADDWLRVTNKGGASPADAAFQKLPADCRGSWFRRSIQLVENAGVMPHAPDRFEPFKEVSDKEIAAWLRAIDPAYAGTVSATGAVMTRERAFAGTVKALFGNDPLKVLQALPPPPQAVSDRTAAAGSTAPDLWSAALASIDGSDNISPAFRPYMTLALATGLLYDQPSLHAKWPLTREVAAWLLAHVLVSRGQETGVVIDAVDIAFEKDRRFGSNPILVRGSDGKTENVYPRPTARSPAPMPDGRFPAAAYAAASSQAGYRVGPRPLVIKAQGAGGDGVHAKELVISPADAARVLDANERSALLDFWRVAILTGVGASLATPSQSPAPRGTDVTIAFSVPMRPSTVDSNSVWLAESAGGEPVAAQVSYDQRSARAVLKPQRRLKSGAEYSVILGDGLLSAEGEQITVEPGLPKGQARRWQLTTDRLLHLTLRVSAVPPTAPIYMNDTLLGHGGGSYEVDVPPGVFRVKAHVGDADQVVEMTADSDGSIDVPMIPPTPARIAMKAAAAKAVVGGQVVVSFTPLDAKGNALARHRPVTLRVDVKGAAGMAPDRVVIADGAGSIALSMVRPGRVIVAATAMQPDLPVAPARLEIRSEITPTGTNSARRAALVFVAPPADPAAPLVRSAATSVLEATGYALVPDDVAQVWQVESQNLRPTAEDAAAVIECFNLTEVFVFELSRSPSSDFLISARIWSREPEKVWPGASDSLQPLAVGRRATEKQLSEAIAGFLSPWVARTGAGSGSGLGAAPTGVR